MAFVATGDECQRSQQAETDEEESEEEAREEPDFFGDFGEQRRRENERQWLDLLESDLGVKVIQQLPDADETGSEFSKESSESEVESISSHEFGVIQEEPIADDDEELLPAKEDVEKHIALEFEDLSDQEELIPDKSRTRYFHKNMRKKINAAMGDVKYLGRTAQTSSTTTLLCEPSVLVTSCQDGVLRPRRRPGPWRIIEIFTWTMAVSFAAHHRGWEVGEPLTLPNYNLLEPQDQRQASEYIREFDPDFLVVAFPSAVWSELRTFGFRSAEYLERLAARRMEQRKMLGWVQDVFFAHRARGGAVLGENPLSSRAWKEPVVIDTWEGLPKQRTDMCAFGLRRPDAEWDPQARGLHLRKPTLLTGQREILKRACRLCSGGHRHSPCLSGVRVRGRWCSMAEFTGGYTNKFAEAVVLGAEDFLKGENSRRKRTETFLTPPLVPEERFMEDSQDFKSARLVFPHDAWAEGGGPEHSDHEGMHLDQNSEVAEMASPPQVSSNLKDLPPTDKMERLMMLHRRLGHPTTEGLMRMLQHAGASDDTVKMAQQLQCPSCQLSCPPKRPHPSRPEVRAVVFNTCVHADLKYLHDYKGGVYVALSVVDEATTYRQAKLLKNRSPGHVAAKFLSRWISLFGPPQTIRLDQGGEWETEFIQMLEAHSIHSEFVGSHSPWSNGYAERHGALLGVAVQAVVEEKQLTGRLQLKLGLAAACQAKNSVISRGGHSAHFLLFGRQACFPELLDDDVWSRKSMGFALSIDGEVARAAELRAAARIALLRGDVLEKIKRALRRAPAGERRSYAPGEMVYFWSPAQPQDRRYKKGIGAWRGPAIVLVPEGADRYFVSWRGRCLLVSGANLKGATVEDANRHDLRDEAALDLAKGYIDISDEPGPPEEPEAPFSAQGPGISSKRRVSGAGRKLSEARRMMAGLKSVKKLIKGPLDPRLQRFRARLRRPRREEQAEESPVDEPIPDVPFGPCAAELDGPSDVEEEAVWDQAPPVPSPDPPANVYDHLDDLPVQLRRWQERKRQRDEQEDPEEQLKRVKTTDFANYVLTAVSEGELTGQRLRANEWLPRREVEQLSHLLDMPLSAARVHRRPRKRLQHPGPRGGKSRVTLMYGENPSQILVGRESSSEVAARPRRRCPHMWRGLSLFLKRDLSHLRQGEIKEAKAILKKGKSTAEKLYVSKGKETGRPSSCTFPTRSFSRPPFATSPAISS